MRDMTRPDGFLLCGHGSRDPVSVAGFEEIARGLARQLAGRPFAHGFMELAAPDLDEAVGTLVAAGAGRILAVPGFLFAARHMHEDLPRALTAAANRHGVEVTLGRELGADPRLVEALTDRIAEAGAVPGGTALVLVGAGSSDAGTNAGLAVLADRLGRAHGFDAAIACYASVARPTVAAAIEAMLARGLARVLLLPWFLTEGSLLGLARAVARAAAGDRAELIEAAALGAHPLVLQTLADRADELARPG
ncbi:MAG TPA: sirohydrochlorin chelatase [Aliidongia sp.]|nr:sirohydrochlorin chelatase [Aliidongia sp.]